MSKSLAHKTGAREAILATIRALTGQANVLTIPREFINYTGSIDCALFLSQLLYWSDKAKRVDGFIYKTYPEWKQEISLSEYEVRKAAKTLKSKGILETDVKKANGSPTVHYRLHLDRFSESFLNFLQEEKPSNCENQAEVTEESLTETTTESTTNMRESPDAPTHPQNVKTSEADSSTVNGGETDRLNDAAPVSSSKSIAATNQAPPARAVPVPEDFTPNVGSLDWALVNYYFTPITEATNKFVAYHRARGTKLKDWNAEWRRWVANEHPIKFDSRGRPEPRYYDLMTKHDGMTREILKAIRVVVDTLCETSPAAHLDDILAAMPDFSRQSLSEHLMWMDRADEDISSPTQDYYCKREYETDPEYRDEVDSWLEERGVEIGVFFDDDYVCTRDEVEKLSPEDRDKFMSLYCGDEGDIFGALDGFVPPNYVSDILSGRQKVPAQSGVFPF